MTGAGQQDAPLVLLTTKTRVVFALLFFSWIFWSRITGLNQPAVPPNSAAQWITAYLGYFVVLLFGFSITHMPNHLEKAAILGFVVTSVLHGVAKLWSVAVPAIRVLQVCTSLVATLAMAMVAARKLREKNAPTVLLQP